MCWRAIFVAPSADHRGNPNRPGVEQGRPMSSNRGVATRRPASDRNPNFVFIFADDWGWGDLGCYGHEHIRTPNLDRLASKGTVFTQFYVCSGVCSPSRAAALTGLFPARLRIHGHLAAHSENRARGMPDWLDPAVPTYARLLRDAGYAVGHYGKWHLGKGPDAPKPFDYGIDECRVNVGNGPQLDFTDIESGPKRSRSSEVIVDESISFIERHRNDRFLLNVWLNDPHAILDPSEEQLTPYREFMPRGLEHRHAGANAVYFAVIENADRHLGRLLDRLDTLALSANTIVIFSSDNGPEDIAIRNASHSGAGSPGPFRGRKRSLYEGGIRTPFILRWPVGNSRSGIVDNDTVLCAADFLPTFCRLAGVDPLPEAGIDGEDMADVFRGAYRPRGRPIFWEWRFGIAGHCLGKSPRLAIRYSDWKLLMNPDGGRIELYDIPRDPMELANQAATHPEVVERLAGLLCDWHASLPPGPVDPDAGSNAYPWPGTT